MDNLKVIVASICFKGEKVLILKRSPLKDICQNQWECGGGKLKLGESFKEAVRRELLEETGYNIKILGIVETHYFQTENGKIPILVFVSQIEEDKEPVLTDEHTEYKFISEDEIDNYEYAGNIKEEIKMAYEIIKKVNQL